MSKITLPIAELKPALTGISKVVNKRCTLPVLNHLKVERTKEGWTALTATDLSTFITVRMEQPSDGDPMTVLVPFEDLQKITKSCQKTDNIFLSGDQESVTIEYAVGSQGAEAKVGSLPVAEFPEIPRIKGDAIPIPDDLRQSIHQALDCSSTDETRLILNGAYIDVSHDDGHYIVGTNGSHLFSSNSFKLPLSESVIVPAHKFIGWKEFNSDGEWVLKIAPPQAKNDEAHIQISSRRWRFITRQIEGNYPNWRQVIPGDSSFKTSILFSDPDALADTIERLPDHDAKDHAIGIERVGNTVHLLWKADREQPWKQLEADAERLKGDEIKVYLNRHYLTKALRFGLNRLQLTDAMSPMRFSNEGRQLIVMPVRTSMSPTAAPHAEETAPQTTTEEQPAAPSTAAQPEKTPMVNDTTAASNAATEPVTIDAQLDLLIEEVETMKVTVQDHLTGLKTLGTKLKGIQREHKSSNKELHAVRQTLKGLQSMKL